MLTIYVNSEKINLILKPSNFLIFKIDMLIIRCYLNIIICYLNNRLSIELYLMHLFKNLNLILLNEKIHDKTLIKKLSVFKINFYKYFLFSSISIFIFKYFTKKYFFILILNKDIRSSYVLIRKIKSSKIICIVAMSLKKIPHYINNF